MAEIDLVAGVAKAWIKASVAAGVPSIDDSHNATSITDGGVGNFTVNWAITMDNANYAALVTVEDTGALVASQASGKTTTTTLIATWEPSTPSQVDPTGFSCAIFGDGPA